MLVSSMGKLAIHGGQPLRQRPFPPWPVSGARERELLDQVLASDQWGGGSELVSRFEELFAQLHDCAHGVAAANGTLALEMALEAAGIGKGDEVIVPAHSFVSTASAVSRVGALPVFVDIERDSYNLDPAQLDQAVRPSTKAMIVVHFGGVMAAMDRVQEAAARLHLTLFEDAAHAHGAEWNGRRAGSLGLAGAFSFQNSKPMTAGEGGILVSNDQEIAARARSLANCGRRPEQGWFHHFAPASNYRLGGLQAAVLLAQLERLPEQIRLRTNNAELLLKALSVPGIRFQAVPDAASSVTFYLLVGRIDADLFGMDRNQLLVALNAEGIPCRSFYPHPLYANPLYQELPCRTEPCPAAEKACQDSFWLPQRLLMGSEEDTLDIARAIEKIYQTAKPRKNKKKSGRGTAGVTRNGSPG